MGDESLVTEQINDGAILVREFDRYAPIKVAFWLKIAEEDPSWDLYLASDEIDGTNLVEAYGEVVRLRRQIESPYLNVFRVKVIYGKSPLARAPAAINAQYASRKGVYLGGQMLGDVFADAAYLYPAPVPAVAS